MASLVQELEREAYDSSAQISNTLRKAKAVAVKLQLKQPIAWVEAELNGYGPGELPEYRNVRGRVKVRNPYHGYQPVLIDDPKLEQMLSVHPVRESVAGIEHLLKGESDPMVHFSGELSASLSRSAGCPELPVCLIIPRASLMSILDAVRNKVLDWSLALQTTGILGEGMSFLPEEKAKASSSAYTYNIGSIGNFAGNLGGRVNGGVHTTSTQTASGELQKVADLAKQLREYRGQIGLTVQEQEALDRNVDALDEEIRGKTPESRVVRGLLGSIRALMEGAAGNLVASGVLAVISSINL